MKAFRTRIVETREISKKIRIIAGISILVCAYFLFIDQREWDPVFINVLRLIYFAALMLGFGLPFRKPKDRGTLSIDEQGMKYSTKEDEGELVFSEIIELKLRYMGYGSWWSHSIYGNKNYLEVVTESKEKLCFEILIKNKEHKNTLKNLLWDLRRDLNIQTLKTGTGLF